MTTQAVKPQLARCPHCGGKHTHGESAREWCSTCGAERPDARRRYQVAGYSDGIWCVVDTAHVLEHADWPQIVWEHPQLGRIWPCSDRSAAQRIADRLNDLTGSGTP